MSADDAEVVDNLREENTRGYAERGGTHRCVFTSDDDPGIPEGYGCGGCSCHLAAPCRHCLVHLADEESDHIKAMTVVLGRWTR